MFSLQIISINEFLKSGQYHTLNNTPNIPLIDTSKLDLVNKISELNNYLKVVSDTLYYLLHPKQLFLLFWSGIVKYSYIVCLFIGLLSILLYLNGKRKSGKWVTGSILIYTLIQALNYAFK